ncbi:MAG: sugar transferase [Candidatus Hydrogenedentes bacterium]|nr:sugar transferase [Candidatus Hydrogenedentota bacterium]
MARLDSTIKADGQPPAGAVQGGRGSAAALDPSTWAVTWGRGRKRTMLPALQVVGEGTVVALSVLIAYLMYASWPPSLGVVSVGFSNLVATLVNVVNAVEFRPFLPLFLLAPIIHLLLFQWLGLYGASLGETRPFGDTWKIVRGTVLGSLVIVMLAYAYGMTRNAQFSTYTPLFFLYEAMLVFFGVLLFHSASLIGVLCLHSLGLGHTRTAVIHGRDLPDTLLSALSMPTSSYRLVGAVSLDAADAALEGVKHLGPLSQLHALINRHDLDEVILAVDPGMLTTEQRLSVAQTCWQMGTELKMVTPFHPFFRTNARPEMVGDVSVLHVENMGLYATMPQLLKRAMDIVLASIGLIVVSPIMILTAILIRIDSPGPIFFVQERVGLNGRTFRMIKFRSMRADSDPKIHQEYLQQLIRGDQANAVDEDGKPIYKIARDPRITRFGQFIRKTSIDELPQAFNVLRGEMSLVGPRPPIQYEVDEYQDWHMKRLHIRPGITGLWQVSGRNRLSFDQMVQLDIAYIEQWSLWLDLKILIKTVPVLLKIDQSF